MKRASKQKWGEWDIITNRTKQNCASGPSLGRMFFFLFIGMFGWQSLFLYFLFHFSGASDSSIADTMRMAVAAACTRI
jgi:hypothetical protein